MRDVTATGDHASDHTTDLQDPADAAGGGPAPEGTHPIGWRPTLTVAPPGRARWPLATALVLLLGVLVGGALMATRLPGGTTLAGAPVATADGAPRALDAAGSALADLRITLVTDVGTTTTVTGADLGLEVDDDVSAQPVQRGLPSLGAWARRIPDGPLALPFVAVPPTPDRLAEVAAAVSRDPIDADVLVRRSGVEVVPGEDGITVDAGQVDAALDAAIAQVATVDPAAWPSEVRAEVRGTTTPPAVGQADIDAVIARVEALDDSTVTLTAQTPAVLQEGEEAEEGEETGGTAAEPPREATSIELTPQELRALVDVVPEPDAPAGERLALRSAPEDAPPRVVALLDLARVDPTVRARVEGRSPPPRQGEDLTDVSEITGQVVVDGQEAGFEPDRAATLEALIDAALAGGGTVEVLGDEGHQADAADLGIVEPVSTFTTFYPAGQSRVQNIQRIAEIVDGVVIPSGDTFELNHFVGRRTTENGFTLGGAIIDGELVSDVGGGVSQFATTFFNAAWFAGVDLVDWKAHSVYFDRYPPGREATINYPNVNLEIRNDTPHAILVDTEAGPTSVTVTFWSTPYWDVETIMGPCGCGGSFSITNARIRTAPGGEPQREEFTTIYTVPRPSSD